MLASKCLNHSPIIQSVSLEFQALPPKSETRHFSKDPWLLLLGNAIQTKIWALRWRYRKRQVHSPGWIMMNW